MEKNTARKVRNMKNTPAIDAFQAAPCPDELGDCGAVNQDR
jgi:hypothetical protein